MPTKRALVSSLVLPLALGASLTATGPSYGDATTPSPPLPTIAIGQRHSLMIAGDGRVWGAGSNDLHELGSCTSTQGFCELAPLPDGRRAVSVAVGMQSSYALSAGGTVYGMGQNDQGQLTGSDATVSTWRELSGQPGTVTSVSAANKTVAVTGTDGRAYVSGVNSCQLNGGATSFSTFTAMESYDGQNVGARRVSLGVGDFCVVVGAHGKAYGVGTNSFGQITPNNGKLVWLDSPAAGVSVRAAAVGSMSTSVLGSDGNIYSIGVNANHQLGDGTTTAATEKKWAQMIGVNGHATSVAAGDASLVVATTGGAVYGVGSNLSHALTGAAPEITVPTLFAGAAISDPIVEVTLSAEGETSFLRDATGVVLGSGYSGYNQLATTTSGTLTKLEVGDGQVMAPSVRPFLSGPGSVGKKLSVRAGTWSVVPDGYAYQWLRNGAAIAGATAAEYVPVSADAGTRLSAQVTGVRTGFVERPTATAASNVPAQNVTKPSITGALARGHKVTAKKGTWYGAGYSYAYQWLRNGKPIVKATGPAYKVTTADHGASISVRVTARKSGFATVTATSPSKKAK